MRIKQNYKNDMVSSFVFKLHTVCGTNEFVMKVFWLYEIFASFILKS